MLVINAVGSAGIEEVAVNQKRAAADVVQHHVQLGDEVVFPDDVPVRWFQFGIRRVGYTHVSKFILERAFIAIRLTFPVQAQDFAPATDHINTVSIHHRARADAAIPLVEMIGRLDSGKVARAGQLPDQFAGGLIHAHQNSAAGGLEA